MASEKMLFRLRGAPGTAEPAELLERYRDANRAGRNTTALEIARLGFTFYPEDSFWCYQFADRLREIGRFNEAEKLLLMVHPRKENNRHLVEISLGRLYHDTGRIAEAERWHKLATETAPEDTAPWVYLAGFFAWTERFEEAIGALENGLKAQGDRDEVWLNLGLNKRALWDYEGARACFENALRISPDYVAARDGLIDINNAITARSLRNNK